VNEACRNYFYQRYHSDPVFRKKLADYAALRRARLMREKRTAVRPPGRSRPFLFPSPNALGEGAGVGSGRWLRFTFCLFPCRGGWAGLNDVIDAFAFGGLRAAFLFSFPYEITISA
jgi:hypothetical protein